MLVIGKNILKKKLVYSLYIDIPPGEIDEQKTLLLGYY